ncbi:hypothetical protein ACWEP8_02000 [Streptomyces hydrogenans]|uniref:hypothetical protein n=1 Tax=Streptomyces hydrogenans TaxID=1873719 RepID=UPI0033298EC7
MDRLLRLHREADLGAADQLGCLVRDLLAGLRVRPGVQLLERLGVDVEIQLEGERGLLAELLEGLVQLLPGGQLLDRPAGGRTRQDGADDGGGGEGLAYGADDGLLEGPITT